MNIHWKDWTLKLLMQRADLLENTLMLGRLKGEEGDDRGWVDWMASPTQWTWIWANSRRWWRTRKPGVLQSMGSKRVWHDWATEQQQPLLPLCPRLFSMSALQIRLWARGEESHRGWDGWMASLTQWTCCCSVAGSCLSLCNPIDYSTPGFHVLHHLPELAQMHVHYSFHFWKFNLDLLYFLFNFGNIVIKKHFLILNY